MAVIAGARTGLAGGKQGHSDASRRISTAVLSDSPRTGPDFAVVETGQDGTGRAPFCRSRFVKVRNEKELGSQRGQAPGSTGQPGSRYEAKSTPGSASHTRSSALRKVAQLESKIMNRKKQMALQEAGLGQKPWDEESVSSASSDKLSGRGKKYLKNSAATSGIAALSTVCSKEEENFRTPKKNVVSQPLLGLDSDEEEMRELMGSSLEISSGNENRRVLGSDSEQAGKKRKTPVSSGGPPAPTEVSTASSCSRDLEKNRLWEVNSPTASPASRSLSGQLVSSMKDDAVKVTLPRRGDTKQSQTSPESDRSEIKSLDELFSKAANAEDSISSNSSDFKPNILSLDDLAPDIQITQESSSCPLEDPLVAEDDSTSLQMASAGTGVSGASDRDIVENTVTEAEISEHLSGVSADFSRHKQDYLDHDERTVSSDYSEDFERSSTDEECRSKTSEEHSESSRCARKHPSPPSSPSLTRAQQGQVRRVTVREAGVQTMDPPSTCHRAKANPHPHEGKSYIDLVTAAGHVFNRDAVEALSAYSPLVLVLNSMLKQHLMLTQQFVENIRHLHLSLMESLENEEFHYHTLEETKEYIKNHKPFL